MEEILDFEDTLKNLFDVSQSIKTYKLSLLESTRLIIDS